MGDFIHLFTGLQKAIQVRDEDDDDEESDEGKLGLFKISLIPQIVFY